MLANAKIAITISKMKKTIVTIQSKKKKKKMFIMTVTTPTISEFEYI